MRLFLLHFGREVSVYAFCGTLAAKANLTKTISSGEKRVWPDGKHLNDVSSGERAIWPDETANRKSSSASEPPHRARRSA